MRAILSFLVVAACVAGCAPTDDEVNAEFQKIVHERASRELPCAWQHVEVFPLSGYAYEAEGCGLVQIYECSFSTGHFDEDKTLYVCQAEGPPMATTAHPTPCASPDGG